MIFLWLLFFWIIHNNAQDVFKKLDKNIEQKNSLVCVGLDPDITKMPLAILEQSRSLQEKIFLFLTTIIDITAPHACCFKVQKAFYDQFSFGHNLMCQVISYIHERHTDMPVFIDAKIGDIDNTMNAYMQAFFYTMRADGVTINPYMGTEVIAPFLHDKNKVGIVLIKTSNPQAGIIQDVPLENGKKVWQHVLNLVVNQWNQNKNLMIVLESNSADHDPHIRQKIGDDMPILIVGIGQQGGDISQIKPLLNKNRGGVCVNSSRAILYPYEQNDPEWESKVLQAVISCKETLNNVGQSYYDSLH